MSNTFSLDQKSKTVSLDVSLLTRQHKFDLITRFIERKSRNPKLTHKQIAKEFGYPTSSWQRYWHDINVLSPCRIPPESHRTKQKVLNREHDLEGPHWNSNDLKTPQMTSYDLTKPDTNTDSSAKHTSDKKNRIILKAGSMRGSIEIIGEFSDRILHNNILKMDWAMQIISNDQTVRSNTVQDLKEYNSQSLAIHSKKGEQKVSIRPAIEKTFGLTGDDLAENETLKNQIGDYDQKWLEDSKTKLLKQIDDEKRANLIMFKIQEQMKNKKKWHILVLIIYGKVKLITSFLEKRKYKI